MIGRTQRIVMCARGRAEEPFLVNTVLMSHFKWLKSIQLNSWTGSATPISFLSHAFVPFACVQFLVRNCTISFYADLAPYLLRIKTNYYCQHLHLRLSGCLAAAALTQSHLHETKNKLPITLNVYAFIRSDKLCLSFVVLLGVCAFLWSCNRSFDQLPHCHASAFLHRINRINTK